MFNIKRILLIFLLSTFNFQLSTVFLWAQETLTLSETPAKMVLAETQTIGETVTVKSETIAIETAIDELMKEMKEETKSLAETQPLAETKPLEKMKPVITQEVAPTLLPSLVKPGLSLMPTAYVRVSPKHPGETGFNSDFLFNFYIGEIYEYVNNGNRSYNVFFTPYRIFMFGADTKWSFTLGQLLKVMGICFGEEYAAGKLSKLLNSFDPGFYKQEQKYFPTIAVGLRGWLFRSMGPSFDLTEAFEGAQWILDYYVVASKKIGDYGFHAGYVYGSFVNNFFNEIKRANTSNMGKMSDWRVNDESNSHTLFVGFDMNVPWGNKKFSVEGIIASPNTFLVNTSTGFFGFDLAFLKFPTGFSIIGYWGFRSNMFTFF